MKRKSITLAAMAFSALGAVSSQGATLLMTNGAGGLGLSLDEATAGTFAVPEIPGLNITVVSVTSNAASGNRLNSTAASFGINDGPTGDDTDEFDAILNEVVVFTFNKAVSITQVDFVNFGSGEAFSFAGQSIQFTDLGSSVYSFAAPLTIAANTQFSLSATSGVIGLEGISLTVIPEPAAALLGGIGLLSLLRRRR